MESNSKPNDICIKMDEISEKDLIECGIFEEILRGFILSIWQKICQNITFGTIRDHDILYDLVGTKMIGINFL